MRKKNLLTGNIIRRNGKMYILGKTSKDENLEVLVDYKICDNNINIVDNVIIKATYELDCVVLPNLSGLDAYMALGSDKESKYVISIYDIDKYEGNEDKHRIVFNGTLKVAAIYDNQISLSYNTFTLDKQKKGRPVNFKVSAYHGANSIFNEYMNQIVPKQTKLMIQSDFVINKYHSKKYDKGFTKFALYNITINGVKNEN